MVSEVWTAVIYLYTDLTRKRGIDQFENTKTNETWRTSNGLQNSLLEPWGYFLSFVSPVGTDSTTLLERRFFDEMIRKKIGVTSLFWLIVFILVCKQQNPPFFVCFQWNLLNILLVINQKDPRRTNDSQDRGRVFTTRPETLRVWIQGGSERRGVLLEEKLNTFPCSRVTQKSSDLRIVKRTTKYR